MARWSLHDHIPNPGEGNGFEAYGLLSPELLMCRKGAVNSWRRTAGLRVLREVSRPVIKIPYAWYHLSPSILLALPNRPSEGSAKISRKGSAKILFVALDLPSNEPCVCTALRFRKNSIHCDCIGLVTVTVRSLDSHRISPHAHDECLLHARTSTSPKHHTRLALCTNRSSPTA